MCKMLGSKFVFPMFLSDDTLKKAIAIAWRCECGEEMFAKRNENGYLELCAREDLPKAKSEGCDKCAASLSVGDLNRNVTMVVWVCGFCGQVMAIEKKSGRWQQVIEGSV